VKVVSKVLGGGLLVIAFLLGSFFIGGRYEIQSAGGAVIRLDKWTGETMLCVPRRCVLYPTDHPDTSPPKEITMP